MSSLKPSMANPAGTFASYALQQTKCYEQELIAGNKMT